MIYIFLIPVFLLLAWALGFFWALIEHKIRMRIIRKQYYIKMEEMLKKFGL